MEASDGRFTPTANVRINVIVSSYYQHSLHQTYVTQCIHTLLYTSLTDLYCRTRMTTLHGLIRTTTRSPSTRTPLQVGQREEQVVDLMVLSSPAHRLPFHSALFVLCNASLLTRERLLYWLKVSFRQKALGIFFPWSIHAKLDLTRVRSEVNIRKLEKSKLQLSANVCHKDRDLQWKPNIPNMVSLQHIVGHVG